MLDALGYLLVSSNVGLYALLAAQLLGSGRAGAPGRATGVAEAFALLGTEIRRTVPGIPSGFTWEEGVEGARRLKIKVDWPRVEEAVRRYEEYRYGGKEEPVGGYEEIGRLARELRRAR